MEGKDSRRRGSVKNRDGRRREIVEGKEKGNVKGYGGEVVVEGHSERVSVEGWDGRIRGNWESGW